MLEFAFETAQQSVSEQRDRLENLRARAATLLSAAAIATSFLGAEALKDTRSASDGTRLADRSLQLLELVAIPAFLAVLTACLLVVRPWKGWIFGLKAEDLVTHYAGKDSDAAKLALINHLEQHYVANEKKLHWLYKAFGFGAVCLGIEVTAWLIDLTRGGEP